MLYGGSIKQQEFISLSDFSYSEKSSLNTSFKAEAEINTTSKNIGIVTVVFVMTIYIMLYNILYHRKFFEENIYIDLQILYKPFCRCQEAFRFLSNIDNFYGKEVILRDMSCS